MCEPVLWNNVKSILTLNVLLNIVQFVWKWFATFVCLRFFVIFNYLFLGTAALADDWVEHLGDCHDGDGDGDGNGDGDGDCDGDGDGHGHGGDDFNDDG